MTDVGERARSHEHGILAPFRSLLTAQVLAALFGFVFWLIVARLVPATDVGIAAAAISAQTLLGMLTSLGLGTMLISELPRHDPPRQRRMILRSLQATSVAAVVVGAIVVGLSRLLSHNLHEALGNPVGAVTFVVGVVAAAAGLVIDDATLGLKRSGVQVARNLFASTLRFPVTILLLVVGFTDSHALQICWVLPLLLSVGAAWWRVRLPGGDQRPPLRADLRLYAGLALRNHALNLFLSAAALLIPVVAGLTLVSVANAQFAIAWLIASFVFLPPYLLAVALFAHGANVSTEDFRASMQTTLPASLALSLVLCLGAWALGEPVLRIFGGEYAGKSYAILAVLVPAGLWMVFKDHLVALWRSQRRFALATRLSAMAMLIELAGAAVGGLAHGGVGLGIGWLCAMGIEIVLALPWLRQSFGGLHFRLPLPPADAIERLPAPVRLLAARIGRGPRPARPVRPERDHGRRDLAVAVVAVLLLAAVGGWAFTRQPSTSVASAPEGTGCPVDPGHPGPKIDLSIQAATSRPSHPLLSPAKVTHLVALAKAAGAQIISTTVDWSSIQPTQGQPYDFSAVDEVLTAARAAGLRTRIVLVGTPAWVQDTPTGSAYTPPLSADELGKWHEFVHHVMRHVRGLVDYVEVWDEPDDQAYWATGPDPKAFARLLRVTYPVIKKVDPSAQVITGGLSGNDIGYLKLVYAALGQARPFDLVGVHPYAGNLDPGVVAPGREYDRAPFGAYDENFEGFRQLHAVMVAAGGAPTKIYIGEFGYSTRTMSGVEGISDALRARYLTSAFRTVTCSPYVAALSWYHLQPTPYDPLSYGLLDQQLQPNDTYRALQAWARTRNLS